MFRFVVSYFTMYTMFITGINCLLWIMQLGRTLSIVAFTCSYMLTFYFRFIELKLDILLTVNTALCGEGY